MLEVGALFPATCLLALASGFQAQLAGSVQTWVGLSSDPQADQYRGPQKTIGFSTENFVLTMKVSFLPPLRGRRLAFYQSPYPARTACFTPDGAETTKCAEGFVGAVAIALYSVQSPNGRPPREFLLRERVTVSAQHPALPVREPFDRTIALVDGVGSDLQVFGFNEQELPSEARTSARREAERLWRTYRQELYANQEEAPFAVIEWKHTIRSITIVRAYTLPPKVTPVP